MVVALAMAMGELWSLATRRHLSRPHLPMAILLRTARNQEVGAMIPFFVRKLFEQTAAKHDISVDYMLKRGRSMEQLRARAEVAYLLRARGWSLPRIGRALGGMHHTSVMHSLKVHYLPDMGRKREPSAIPCPDLSGEWAI